MAKYSKQILSFCETDKCEYFSCEDKYALAAGNKKGKSIGKIYYCSHPDLVKDKPIARSQIVTLSCPKKQN